ncbi:metal ABC transporter substrate-binding protein [Nocardioides sp. URHA0032]|uniref:metal ABC transporter substrate-binding protein n=1 Tax=Nocardioides sp. URHA0032 TaxID=1380388 RepID=UPI00048DF80E|nr:metal ABC transporter substrate-binding protein [Nocardioides sp. URHA0032]
MKALVALALPGLLVLSGCAAFTDDSVGLDNGVQVAAAFYPLAYVAARVAGDAATVENLTAPGGEPHDLEPTVRETAEVAQADLVVFERGFQPAVDDTVDENAGGAVLDAADVVSLVPFRDHGVDSDEDDPHFWQDPLLLAEVGDAVADQLSDIDPAHADDYAANAEALRGDLERLDREYAAGLADCQRDTVVVSHDAFGYLERYGIDMQTILGLSPDSEPTPADLARLQDLINSQGITTVFGESLVSPAVAEALAHDTGVRSEVLDPIEGLSDRTAGEDYLSLMHANLRALEEANGCG